MNRYNFELRSEEDIPKSADYLNIKDVEGMRASQFYRHGQEIFVLEPDLLLPSTKVISQGATYSHLQYFIESFIGETICSEAIIVGNIVGDIFQRYCEKTIPYQLHYDDLIAELMQEYELDLNILSTDRPAMVKIINMCLVNLLHLFPQSVLINVYCEVDMISPLYGLRGRPDIIIFTTHGVIILDLKTSKPPRNNLECWPTHKKQSISYSMMGETALSKKVDKVGILYPKSNDASLRYFDMDELLISEIISSRNNAIMNSALISRGEVSRVFDLAEGQINNRVPVYMRDKVSLFKKIIRSKGTGNDIISEISDRLAFLERENLHGMRNFSNVWRGDLETKVSRKDISNGLTLSGVVNKKISLSGTNQSSIRVGDRVLVYSGDGKTPSDSVKGILVSGSVVYADSSTIDINSNNNKAGLKIGGKFSIEKDYSSSTMGTCQKSVVGFFASSSKYPRLYFGGGRPVVSREAVVISEDYGFNDNQVRAMKKALGSKDYFLLQGPPGAGKTYFITALLNELIKNGESVLLSGFTNSSVDNTLLRYVERFKSKDVVRLVGARVKSSFEELVGANLIGVTAIGAIYNKVFKVKQFDTVVIEEASQLLDEHIMYILSVAKRVIMIGDHIQMPPVVAHSLDESYDYYQSIFEKLYIGSVERGYDHAYETLNSQYRMTPKISRYISNQFYDGKLKSMVEEKGKDGIYFKNFDDFEQGKSNKTEANYIKELVAELVSEGITAEDIGVVAPFRAQVALVRETLKDSAVEVDTVEKYQGREKEVIIFSSVSRSIDCLRMMSPRDGLVDKKLNVAISRAKHRVYVLGNSYILGIKEEYRELMSVAITMS